MVFMLMVITLVFTQKEDPLYQSDSTDVGILATGSTIGIQAITNGSGSDRYGAYISVENAVDGSVGVQADLINDSQPLYLGLLEN